MFFGIKRTYAHLARFRHILTVLIKYGFEEAAGLFARRFKVGLGSQGIPSVERERMTRMSMARRVRLVALKRGAQGSTLYTPEGALDVPPFQVEEVDPTGAGDCYAAALLVALDEGLPLAVAGAFANAAGALATTRLGPMEGAFPREEVLAFMAAQGRPAYWV